MKSTFAIFSTILCAFTVLASKTVRSVRNGHEPSHIAREDGYTPRGWPKKPKPGFLSKKTAEFYVDGPGLPDIPFHIGVLSFHGSFSTLRNSHLAQRRHWMLLPRWSPPRKRSIHMDAGHRGPETQPYSWTNLTNVLYVEQPVGTGYSQGNPEITNERELASEFRGFYEKFQDKFDVKGWRVYLTGQGYAGMYIPYIASELISGGLDEDDGSKPAVNVRGVLINNPRIGDSTVESQVPILDYIERYKHIMDIDESTMADIRRQSRECGYTDFWQKYFKFPAPQESFQSPSPGEDCDILYDTIRRISQRNPCFNPKRISDSCPKLENPYQTIEDYLNRRDVRKHLHAPPGPKWVACKEGVFNTPSGWDDDSTPPALDGVLNRVISNTNNIIIGSGELDMTIPAHGTLLAIQNLKWGSAYPHQGLKEYPRNKLFVPQHAELDENNGKTGVQGRWVKERGLTFYSADNAGANVPGDHPGLAFRALEVLLGRIPDLGSREPFTTQRGAKNIVNGEGTSENESLKY